MMLNKDEILTLDDNKKYVVAYTTELNSKNYAFLVDIDDFTNTMFCEYDNQSGLEEVVDPNVIEKILAMYQSTNN